MAQRKKRQDPSEAALSAIEQALNLEPHKDELEAAAAAEPRSADPGETDPAEEETSERPVELRPAAPDPRLPVEPRPSVVAPDRAAVANDDSRNIGLLLQALQRRPSPQPYVFALLASLAWLGGLGCLAYLRLDGAFGAFLDGLTPYQVTLGAAALIGPVVLFFVAALLAVRSQEMRLVARAVGEVAIRLSQPETFSSDAVVTVSQAVRREVAAVGDGIERAARPRGRARDAGPQ